MKARIEEFNALAGHEQIHKGMTSRDLTENVEQLQVRDSLLIVRDKLVALLARLAALAVQYTDLPLTGRSHNVAAQTTTLGKRFASAADELLVAYDRLDELLARYPLRGIKGPVGTAQDMLDLLDGDEVRLAALEQRVAEHLGFARVLTSVGQVYPAVASTSTSSRPSSQAAAAPSSLATTIRLMAGLELVTEGFQPGQVGLLRDAAQDEHALVRAGQRLRGDPARLLSMMGELAGDQWNEGDVSCSVVRRVALPDAFFAIDGLLETFLTVLDEFGAFPAVIARELDRYLPFLATTKVLIAAVRHGVGRETAHEVIKEHAVAVALEMREKGDAENDLLDRLARGPAPRAEPRGPRRAGRRPDRLHRRGAGPGPHGRRGGRCRGGRAPRSSRLHPGRDPLAPRRPRGGRGRGAGEDEAAAQGWLAVRRRGICAGWSAARVGPCRSRRRRTTSRPGTSTSTPARSATCTPRPTARSCSSRPTASARTTSSCRPRSPTRAASSRP